MLLLGQWFCSCLSHSCHDNGLLKFLHGRVGRRVEHRMRRYIHNSGRDLIPRRDVPALSYCLSRSYATRASRRPGRGVQARFQGAMSSTQRALVSNGIRFGLRSRGDRLPTENVTGGYAVADLFNQQARAPEAQRNPAEGDGTGQLTGVQSAVSATLSSGVMVWARQAKLIAAAVSKRRPSNSVATCRSWSRQPTTTHPTERRSQPAV